MIFGRLASFLSCQDEHSTKDLWKKIDEKIDSYFKGDLDHAEGTVILMWKLSRAGVGSSPPPPEKKPWPANELKCVDTALAKSIRKGIFFDRKYWAKTLRPGSTVRSIYTSSIIASEYLKKLDRRG